MLKQRILDQQNLLIFRECRTNLNTYVYRGEAHRKAGTNVYPQSNLGNCHSREMHQVCEMFVICNSMNSCCTCKL